MPAMHEDDAPATVAWLVAGASSLHGQRHLFHVISFGALKSKVHP
jgi:hypothetical protein